MDKGYQKHKRPIDVMKDRCKSTKTGFKNRQDTAVQLKSSNKQNSLHAFSANNIQDAPYRTQQLDAT